jgi:hypothetical protein
MGREKVRCDEETICMCKNEGSMRSDENQGIVGVKYK